MTTPRAITISPTAVIQPSGRLYYTQLLTGLVFFGLLSMAVTSLVAQPATSPKPATVTDKPGSGKSSLPPLTEERETAAWGFVMQHHPELGEVLSRLKTMHPAQYERAIAQVNLAIERINRFAKTDAKRGEMELRDWKLESQIKLLAAKLALRASDQETVRTELAAVIKQQLELRTAITELDRERAAARLKTLDEQLTRQKQNLAEDTEKRLKQLQEEIDRTRKTMRPGKADISGSDANKPTGNPNNKSKAAE